MAVGQGSPVCLAPRMGFTEDNFCHRSGQGWGGWRIFTPQGEESPGSLLGWGRGVLLFAQPQVPAWGKAGPGAEETGQQSLRGGEGSALKPPN